MNFKRKKKRPMQKQRQTYTSGVVIPTPDERRLRHRVADEIDEAMSATGLSRSELARRLQVTRGAVTQFLGSEANLEMDTLERIADALGAECEVALTVPKEMPVTTTNLSVGKQNDLRLR